jgi:hypothetical protein
MEGGRTTYTLKVDPMRVRRDDTSHIYVETEGEMKR